MFGLDPESIAERVRAANRPASLPTLGQSVTRGAFGFTVVSIGGFAPWVLAGRWFYQNVGELGLYAACLLVFVGLSGWLLRGLIIGPGTLLPFYQLFGLSFGAYAVVWTFAWMTLGGAKGGGVGALAGTAAMTVIIALAFRATNAIGKCLAVLFITNAAGYFIGGWAYEGIGALREGNAFGIELSRAARGVLSKLAWGACYGLGFGAGLGYVFHACQQRVREQLPAGGCAP